MTACFAKSQRARSRPISCMRMTLCWHFMVIPKQHIESAAKLTEADAALLGHIYATIADLCKQLGVDESGYRVVTNVGADGGQSVKHLHFHVLAKRSLAWPPG